MKGLTPVIGIILLLMITISIVGFAFVWFTRVTGIVTNQTGAAIDQQQQQMVQTVQIDSIDDANDRVHVRNTGSVNIGANTIAVYINNALRTCTSWSVDPIPPDTVSSCTVSGGFTCPANFKVTSPGTPQGDTASC